MKYFTSFIILLLLSLPKMYAQTSDTLPSFSLQLHNNQIFTGELVSITSDSIVIIGSNSERLSFHRKKIKRFRKGLITNYLEKTTNSSVPFYVQTALPNGNGNHYYKNYYIFGNEFNFGMSDNLNLTVGFETASLIFDYDDGIPIIQLGGKYGSPINENFHLGFYTNYYFNSEGSALLLGVPMTLGNKRSNFTFAPSYIRGDGDGFAGFFANVSVAVSPKVRFVIDYLNADGESVSAILFEILFKNGFTLSFGGFVGDGSIPNLSFSIPFGKWKNKN